MFFEGVITIAAIAAGLSVLACLAVIDHWRQRDHTPAFYTEDVSHDKDPFYGWIPECRLIRYRLRCKCNAGLYIFLYADPKNDSN